MMLSQISQPIKQMVCNAKDMDILKIRRGGHKLLILCPIQCNLVLLHPFNVPSPSSIHGIDLWYGEKALMEVFPDLYGIACTKDAFVAAHLKLYGGFNQ